ncbi:MAG: IS4 family transposase [Gorillibacterium sp.]|nr:IS4 family transposase [Gorillibacterium sp.]
MIRTDFKGCFGDIRLDKRGMQLHAQLFSNATRSIQAMASSRAEQKAFYRFLRNEKTSEQKIIDWLTGMCGRRVADKVVLSIQDTTEINLSSHTGRLQPASGLGGLDDAQCTGFKLHPSFVVDAYTCFPIGFSDIRIWHRDPETGSKKERNYMRQPIEDKESYKWADSSANSKIVLSKAKAVIIVQDREGDIFSQFVTVPDDKTFLLIRSRVNRIIAGQEEKLWDALSAAEPSGRYELYIPADSHSKRPARNAVMEVRVKGAILPCPPNDKVNCQKTVPVYAIEAREIGVEHAEPVLWRLLTTWPIEGLEDALLAIEWYTWRWLIEELFRVLKKECYDIEGSELESGWAIRKLTVVMLDTIVKLMQMHIAYNCAEGEDPEAGMVFTPEQQQCLAVIEQKVSGNTEKLKNPFAIGQLKWAVWVIARLGGWKGYSSQRKPGMTTLLRGLEKFSLLYEGYNLMDEDVGTR